MLLCLHVYSCCRHREYTGLWQSALPFTELNTAAGKQCRMKDYCVLCTYYVHPRVAVSLRSSRLHNTYLVDTPRNRLESKNSHPTWPTQRATTRSASRRLMSDACGNFWRGPRAGDSPDAGSWFAGRAMMVIRWSQRR